MRRYQLWLLIGLLLGGFAGIILFLLWMMRKKNTPPGNQRDKTIQFDNFLGQGKVSALPDDRVAESIAEGKAAARRQRDQVADG